VEKDFSRGLGHLDRPRRAMVLSDLFVCGFSALRAEKPHTIEHGVPLCRRLARPIL
jgi:hypothetical protein